jgi:hypothetical protein
MCEHGGEEVDRQGDLPEARHLHVPAHSRLRRARPCSGAARRPERRLAPRRRARVRRAHARASADRARGGGASRGGVARPRPRSAATGRSPQSSGPRSAVQMKPPSRSPTETTRTPFGAHSMSSDAWAPCRRPRWSPGVWASRLHPLGPLKAVESDRSVRHALQQGAAQSRASTRPAATSARRLLCADRGVSPTQRLRQPS